MTKEYQQLYKEHGELMLESFKELNIYLNGYRSLLNSENVTGDSLNLFRLSYCAWFYAMENCILLREHIRASNRNVEIEHRYSLRKMLVAIYEMNKHLFGVEEQTEKRELWNVAKPLLMRTDSQQCSNIDAEIQSFKSGFVTMRTKNARGLFEHYSDSPELFEQEMKELTAEIGDVHMLKFIQIMCRIAKLAAKHISSDMILFQYIDTSVEVDNDPEMTYNESLANLQRFLLIQSNNQVGCYSVFATFYDLAGAVSEGAPDSFKNRIRTLKDFNELQFLCTQIQRDISYTLLSVTASESRIEQFLNVRYVFRHLHEGFKRIYGYTTDSQEQTSYWVRCVKPYIHGVDDETIITQFNEMDALLKDYSVEEIKDEKKRALLTHIRIKTKKQDDYIPDLMDWCQSTSLISELKFLTDFQNTIMKLSDFTNILCKEILRTIK